MSLRAAACALLLAVPAAAQETEAVQVGTGAVLRGLDKINGTIVDMDLATGETAQIGYVQVRMDQCRYPEGNPAGDAYAFITIRVEDVIDPLFQGWMIASAPALNALDHPRYDVWVLRCKT